MQAQRTPQDAKASFFVPVLKTFVVDLDKRFMDEAYKRMSKQSV